METFEGKYVSLTSFKRDGTAVATPVWFVAEDGRLLVETDADSWKVKRIRRDPHVTVAPCTVSGKQLREPVYARAEILPESERERVHRLLARKYRVDRMVIVPLSRLVQWLRRQSGDARPLALSITPE